MPKKRKKPVKSNPQKNPVGRPRIFQTVEELDTRIDDYFKQGAYIKVAMTMDNKPIKKYMPTLTGLVLHLGFTCKEGFYEYGRREEFSASIKKARTLIEQSYEMQLKGQYCSGAIFALKNFDWKDKFEIETPPATINIFVKNILTKAGLDGQPEREINPSHPEIQNRLN